MVTCYVDQIAPDNWLTVKTEPSGVRISLPYGLKLELTGTTGGREQFTVLEGINEGKRCSVTQKDGGGSYLTANLRHRPAGTVVFDLAAQSLTFGDRGPYNAFSGGGFQEFTPVAKGRYPLAIPAFPTAQTRPPIFVGPSSIGPGSASVPTLAAPVSFTPARFPRGASPSANSPSIPPNQTSPRVFLTSAVCQGAPPASRCHSNRLRLSGGIPSTTTSSWLALPAGPSAA
jgi:hypothetical protein